MRKKLTVIMLILTILMSFILTGCNSEPLLIVFLGDSIAEAIAGMSPLSERERYGYYGLIGARNEYEFKNRAVSGHQTKDLLALLKQEDKDARMMQTVVRNADIIHISILGNDLLLNDLGEIIYSVAKDDFSFLDSIIEESVENFAEIVRVLRGYNKDAVIMFQNVYNPVFLNCDLINEKTRENLDSIGVTESEYREYAGIILSKLNGIISDYLKEHPGEFYIIDSQAGFESVYQKDHEFGESLIFCDCIHPSNAGHAVLADLTQAKLEELGLADKKTALKNYKEIRKEQLKRLYNDSVNVKEVSRQIDKAKDCSEVTEIYFKAIADKKPAYC